MVRMGNKDSMHPSVQAFHMDALGEKFAANGVTSLATVVGESGRPVLLKHVTQSAASVLATCAPVQNVDMLTGLKHMTATLPNH